VRFSNNEAHKDRHSTFALNNTVTAILIDRWASQEEATFVKGVCYEMNGTGDVDEAH